MKTVFFALSIILAAFSVTPLTAQEKSDKATEREQRKQEEQERYRENLETFQEWIESRNFVILASNITGRYGTTYNLHPTVNFIEVNRDDITIQTSHPYRTGYNGLGGITTQGQVTGIRVFENEAGEPISMTINFTTTLLGASSLSVHVNGSGNATAFLRANRGNQVTFRGEFAQADSSLTYQGMQVY